MSQALNDEGSQMQKKYLDILVCPICGSQLKDSGFEQDSELRCVVNGHIFQVKDAIPRFVDPLNYANSFGFQWNKFSRVQLDSFNGTKFSEERFYAITNWGKEDLGGKLVLDAGCGAGRFSEVAIRYGAELIAFDLSDAVTAWQDNLSTYGKFVCQASVYEMPFQQEAFDYVYCIGVVQHTPDPEKTIRALCKLVKPGGQIGLWIYERDWKSYVGTLGFKYALRPIFALLSRTKQYALCEKMVELLFPVIAFCKARGLFGKIIMRLLPISSAHLQDVPLKMEDFKAWVILDTFDMYSPTYDQPSRYQDVAKILKSENFENIQRQPHGGIAITAKHLN